MITADRFDDHLPLTAELNLAEQADQALARLDGLASFPPDLGLFICAYVRSVAVSKIEGTQASLSDLLLFDRSRGSGHSPRRLSRVSFASLTRHEDAVLHAESCLADHFPLPFARPVEHQRSVILRVVGRRGRRARKRRIDDNPLTGAARRGGCGADPKLFGHLTQGNCQFLSSPHLLTYASKVFSRYLTATGAERSSIKGLRSRLGPRGAHEQEVHPAVVPEICSSTRAATASIKAVLHPRRTSRVS